MPLPPLPWRAVPRAPELGATPSYEDSPKSHFRTVSGRRISLEKSKQSKRPLDILYAKIALPQIPVFQLRIIFVIKKKKKSLGAGGRTLYEAAL